MLSPLLEQIAVGPTDGTVGVVVRNAAATGEASLLLDANNQNGVAELKALAGGGVMLNSFQQFISFNNTSGLTNLAIEPNIGGSNDGEVIFGYGFVNHPGGGAAADLRCGGDANLRPHRRRQGADRLRGPGRAGQWEAGRDDAQDQEPGRSRADDSGLPEALGGPVGCGEIPAEEGGEAREEEARALELMLLDQ